jgi:hypothetical protein
MMGVVRTTLQLLTLIASVTSCSKPFDAPASAPISSPPAPSIAACPLRTTATQAKGNKVPEAPVGHQANARSCAAGEKG